MVVQHNMQAVNANRMLNVTVQNQGKSTEKLSSGYRINRAADDAAGLSISEKMRKQIRGLDRASTNADDGVSSVQTAEGALTEVHDMLQRMNELAVQAANGTNSASDRTSIQNEIDQLTTEIDRVAETTKFNETYLLKGQTGGDAETPAEEGTSGAEARTALSEMSQKEIEAIVQSAEESNEQKTAGVEARISALVEKYQTIMEDLSKLVRAYNNTIINDSSVQIGKGRFYGTPGLLSSQFIVTMIKTAGPFCCIGLMICLVMIIADRKKKLNQRKTT
jgi:flagellin-like hook-associated protein FlgL